MQNKQLGLPFLLFISGVGLGIGLSHNAPILANSRVESALAQSDSLSSECNKLKTEIDSLSIVIEILRANVNQVYCALGVEECAI